MDDHKYTFYFMPEIEDEIFEFSARMHPTFAPTLTLVSKRVQMRVEYIIYESVILCSTSKDPSKRRHMSYCEKFELALNARPAEFFARRVRNLAITNSVSEQTALRILAVCTGVRNLAVWLRRDPLIFDPSAHIIVFSSTLSSLSTDRLTIIRMANLQSIFPHLTWLSVLGWPKTSILPTLEWLPKLTTVTLNGLSSRMAPDALLNDVETVTSTVPLLNLLTLKTFRYLPLHEVALHRILEEDPRIILEIDRNSGAEFLQD